MGALRFLDWIHLTINIYTHSAFVMLIMYSLTSCTYNMHSPSRDSILHLKHVVNKKQSESANLRQDSSVSDIIFNMGFNFLLMWI